MDARERIALAAVILDEARDIMKADCHNHTINHTMERHLQRCQWLYLELCEVAALLDPEESQTIYELRAREGDK